MNRPSRPPPSNAVKGRTVVLGALVLLLSACGATKSTSPAKGVDAGALGATRQMTMAIGAAVDRWAGASTLAEAGSAAEEARNLITGPATLMAGDLDHDGTTKGAVDQGLLPGTDGHSGLALPLAGCPLVQRDLLGGSWADPTARWQTLAGAIAGWSASNNTFPALPSQAQRIVGWASLSLAATDLGTAHEFAGHAQLHVTAIQDALRACG